MAGAAMLLAVLGVFGNAGVASAHAELIGTDPTGGSTVLTPPQEIRLTFDDNVDPHGASVQVTGPDGAHWETGPLEGSGVTLATHLRPQAPAGQYTVDYRVVSDDGHPVSGLVRFAVAAPAPGAAGAAQSAAASDGLPVWPLALGVVVVVAVAAGVVVRLRRPTSS